MKKRSSKIIFLMCTALLAVITSFAIGNIVSNEINKPELSNVISLGLLAASFAITFGMKHERSSAFASAIVNTQSSGATAQSPTVVEGTAAAIVNRSAASTPQRMPIAVPQMNMHFADEQEYASANTFPFPASITVVVASATGAGAVATRVFLFNQDVLNNITNNTSGAGSITYTYQDGFAGKIVSRLLSQARAGVGGICFAVAIRMNITSSGAGDPAGLAATNPNFQVFNALGSSQPLNFNVTAQQNRQDFDTSIEVMPCVQNIGAFTQFSMMMPVGDTATVTFYFRPGKVS